MSGSRIPLQHPFSMIVAAPSMSGKSVWVANLIKNKNIMIKPVPQQIIWCYTEYQPLYDSMKKSVTFHKGLIPFNELDSDTPKLVICDDMLSDINEQMSDCFTKYVHHKSMSFIFVSQNLYQKGQHMRNMNLNASYLVLFKNPRDCSQINCLSRQMYPSGQGNFMVEAFRDATNPLYGYLFVDLKQTSDELMRLRTGIFPHENHYIYMPKKRIGSLDSFRLDG